MRDRFSSQYDFTTGKVERADVIDLIDPVAAFTELAVRVNDDDFLVHRGRFLTADILVEIGELPFIVAIE